MRTIHLQFQAYPKAIDPLYVTLKLILYINSLLSLL